MKHPIQERTLPEVVAEKQLSEDTPRNVPRPVFEPNIEGAIARLQLSSGPALFCDVLLLTERDVVLAIPKTETLPDRGEEVRCSLFLLEDDSYVAHREGIIHWEMALREQRLAAVFLKQSAPEELVALARQDRRKEVRYPANISCSVYDRGELKTGRLVNYSLNGLAVLLPEPLEVGQSYTVTIVAGEEDIEIDVQCRWRTDTKEGFVNACSCENDQGWSLARKAFRGSAMPWDMERADGHLKPTEAVEKSEAPRTKPVVEAEEEKRPVIGTTTILILALMLIGLAPLTPTNIRLTMFLCGCVGVITYIGLIWTSRMRRKFQERKQAEKVRETAENRLVAHLSRPEQSPQGKPNEDTSNDSADV